MKLTELCNHLVGAQYRGPCDVDGEITGISCDSRKIEDGNVFVAIPGTRVDGHDFIHEALTKGAAAVVTEKRVCLPEDVPHITVPSSAVAVARLASGSYGEPSNKLSIIGVTGTNGKTTTAYLLHSMLMASSKKAGLLGSVHYQVGDRLIDSTQTTPDPVELHRLLHKMANAGTTHVVMEVSSHALTQRRTYGIEFCGAVFTNLAMDHLDYHSNLTNYRDAKAELFRNLPVGAFAVLNRDDPASLYFSLQTDGRVFWYGLRSGSGVRAKLINLDLDGMCIRLSDGQEEVIASTRLMGSHNLCNILAASTTALALGVSLEEVKEGIESLTLIPGRLERVAVADGYSVFVDYAHTSDALESVLNALRPLVKNRLLLVFGCGGDRDKGKRPLMGSIGEKLSDYFWITSDNPRSERPMSIIKDIEKGILGKDYGVEPDRRRAIEDAVKEARDGDVVLVAGKGHERVQVLSDRAIWFDDREVVREIVKRNGGVCSTAGEETTSREQEARVGVSVA
ncbi:MAG: UDP-N-acetylmuramoyl-L-alanyl-D-glutamate--2,6-diaminopimelate ligase [Candidatus Brocadiales bacterium]|nr:UDP-N-acetylmuramoyl-L-alanyl-D-glutamate--2,6-diaminopimelate ligase [Candidatus Bathyanammoxibius amoris]